MDKVPLTYLAVNPSAKELDFLVRKALKEKEILIENRALKTKYLQPKTGTGFFRRSKQDFNINSQFE